VSFVVAIIYSFVRVALLVQINLLTVHRLRTGGQAPVLVALVYRRQRIVAAGGAVSRSTATLPSARIVGVRCALVHCYCLEDELLLVVAEADHVAGTHPFGAVSDEIVANEAPIEAVIGGGEKG